MREGLTGQLQSVETNEVMYPPDENTHWDSANLSPLWHYLRTVGDVSTWDPMKCLVAFPRDTDPSGLYRLTQMMEEVNAMPQRPQPLDYKGKPIPVVSPPVDRLKENLADRTELCLYDEILQKTKVIHFKFEHGASRLLVHFYSFLFFEDWRQELFYKRFVRDNIRYTDQLVCTAARVVEAIRERARARDPVNNPKGEFDAFHVRRGDFQYKKTRIEADVIYNNSKEKLTEGATVYIATDELNKQFFKALADHYDVCFLDDFSHMHEGLDEHFLGMIDQLVVYKSRVFVGTWFSTFSAYINRLKGYYISKYRLEGYDTGTMKSWYFAPMEKFDEMQYYWPSRKPFYMREFPTAWRDIDMGFFTGSDADEESNSMVVER